MEKNRARKNLYSFSSLQFRFNFSFWFSSTDNYNHVRFFSSVSRIIHSFFRKTKTEKKCFQFIKIQFFRLREPYQTALFFFISSFWSLFQPRKIFLLFHFFSQWYTGEKRNDIFRQNPHTHTHQKWCVYFEVRITELHNVARWTGVNGMIDLIDSVPRFCIFPFAILPPLFVYWCVSLFLRPSQIHMGIFIHHITNVWLFWIFVFPEKKKKTDFPKIVFGSSFMFSVRNLMMISIPFFHLFFLNGDLLVIAWFGMSCVSFF